VRNGGAGEAVADDGVGQGQVGQVANLVADVAQQARTREAAEHRAAEHDAAA
jgi:hypothetical protein